MGLYFSFYAANPHRSTIGFVWNMVLSKFNTTFTKWAHRKYQLQRTCERNELWYSSQCNPLSVLSYFNIHFVWVNPIYFIKLEWNAKIKLKFKQMIRIISIIVLYSLFFRGSIVGKWCLYRCQWRSLLPIKKISLLISIIIKSIIWEIRIRKNYHWNIDGWCRNV